MKSPYERSRLVLISFFPQLNHRMTFSSFQSQFPHPNSQYYSKFNSPASVWCVWCAAKSARALSRWSTSHIMHSAIYLPYGIWESAAIGVMPSCLTAELPGAGSRYLCLLYSPILCHFEYNVYIEIDWHFFSRYFQFPDESIGSCASSKKPNEWNRFRFFSLHANTKYSAHTVEMCDGLAIYQSATNCISFHFVADSATHAHTQHSHKQSAKENNEKKETENMSEYRSLSISICFI